MKVCLTIVYNLGVKVVTTAEHVPTPQGFVSLANQNPMRRFRSANIDDTGQELSLLLLYVGKSEGECFAL